MTSAKFLPKIGLLLLLSTILAGALGCQRTRGPITGTEHALVGQTASDFQAETFDGTRVALSDLRGQVVLLDFWATYCAPCRAAMPHIQRMHEELDAHGLELLSLNLDRDNARQRVEDYMQSNSFTFPVWRTNRDTLMEYEAARIPYVVIIDRQGVITHVFRGGVSPAIIERAVHQQLAL